MGQYGASAMSLGGTIIGSYFGGPWGGAIGGMAGGIVGGLLFRTKKPLIQDTQTMNSSYGNPIPILYGTARLPGIMMWATQVQTKATGLLKGGAQKYPYSYHQSVAMAFCEGPATCIKIWLDGRIFWDSTSAIPRELTKHTFAIRGYEGTQDQLPDYLINEWVADNVDDPQATPAFRGIAYMVLDGMDLAYYGTRLPMVTAAYSSNAALTTFFNPAVAFAPDVSPDTTPLGMATDWVRGVIYQLSDDGTIRVFSTTTYDCINARTMHDLFFNNAAVLSSEVPDPIAAGVSLGFICCGSGGDLYVCTSVTSTPKNTIYEIDPNTLVIMRVMTVPCTGVIWSLQCWTGPVANSPPGNIIAAVGLGGTGDMLVCTLYATSLSPPPFAAVIYPGKYVDPVAYPQYISFWFAYVPPELGSGNTNTYTSVAIGRPDPTLASTTLYLLNTESYANAPNTPMYYSAISVPYTDIAEVVGPITVTAATFGVPGGTAQAYDAPPPMLHDPVDGNLIIFNNPYYPASDDYVTVKVDSNSLALLWTCLNGPTVEAGRTFIPNTDITDQTFVGFEYDAPSNPGAVPVLDTQTGTISFSPISAADAPIYGTPGEGGVHWAMWNSVTGQIVYALQALAIIAKPLCTISSGVTIASILTDLCGRVGITPDLIDVSAVTATTTGYVVRDNRAAGAAIHDLCQLYQIDMVESDWLLKFIPRGQAVAATIAQADLASTDQQDQGQFWNATRALEQEMPLEIALKYSDPDLDYQPGSAYARRNVLAGAPTVWTKRKLTMDIPVVVTNAVATSIAQNWLFTTYAERTTYQTMLSWKYLWLDPTDNIDVVLSSGASYTVRIESIETGAEMALQLHCADEDLTVYAPAGTPGATYSIGKQTLSPIGFASLLMFNVPLLQDTDSVSPGVFRVYYAAGASNARFTGGAVYQSTDGVNWPQYGAIGTGANYGAAQTALGDTVAKFATDLVNTVRVSLGPGSTAPSSCAYVDLMNGANAALLGQEIIQFQTVTDNADGSFTLSRIVRGRRGTEWATGTHLPGDLFLLLQPGPVVANVLSTGDIGVAEQYQLVPVGANQSQVAIRTFTYLGYDLYPYAPVNFTRAPSGSDLAVAWLRRTRIGGLLIDGTDTVPLNEESELYDAYVLPTAAALTAFNPANSATYTRAFIGLTSPGLTYTAAEMTADGFTPATATLFLVVYQVSAVVGRGFQGYQALPAF